MKMFPIDKQKYKELLIFQRREEMFYLWILESVPSEKEESSEWEKEFLQHDLFQ